MAKKAVAKKAEAQLVRCMECEHSTLMQWFTNPVIAECAVRKSFGRPERQVARMTHVCEQYKRYTGIIKPIKNIQK